MGWDDLVSESPSQRAGSVEGAITAAEQRYRLLIDRLPAVTYLARVEPHADLYVSPQVEALLGFTQAEWLANPALWVERLHPQDRARVRAEWAAAQAEGGPFRSEYRLLGRDGRAVWV